MKNLQFKLLNRLVYLVFFGCALILFVPAILQGVPNILSWDSFGYYLYLPSNFIYDDIFLIDQNWIDNIFETYQPSGTFYQVITQEDGVRTIKYPIGMALFYLPFFFVGHLAALISNYPVDGFSLPYKASIFFGSIFHGFLGFLMFLRNLKLFFTQKTQIVLLLLLTLGTNYLAVNHLLNGTPHQYLFLIYCVLVYATVFWHKSFKPKYAFLIGACMGLLVITRPSDILAIFIPILWQLTNFKSLKNKLYLIVKKHKNQLIIAVISGLVVCLPQMWYWYFTTGNLIYYSYQNPGEGFDFFAPHTVDYLFSFRKGWFVYSPVFY